MASKSNKGDQSHVVTAANHRGAYHSPPSQLLKREAILAPVTAVSILPSSAGGGGGGRGRPDRVILARGSYLESVPLFVPPLVPVLPEAAAADNSAAARRRQYSGRQRTYRHKTYGDGCESGGTIHGVRYAKPHCPGGTGRNSSSSSSHLGDWISSVMAVFGERKVAFLSGGDINESGGSRAAKAGGEEDGDGDDDCDDPFQTLYVATKAQAQHGSSLLDTSPPTSPYLTMSDLVWDVSLLVVVGAGAGAAPDGEEVVDDDNDGDNDAAAKSDSNDDDGGSNLRILAAVGLAHNIVEIWSLASTTATALRPTSTISSDGKKKEKVVLVPNRIRKIICDVRCITYSLTFYGWGGGRYGTESTVVVDDLSLSVAVGTPSSLIYVWSVLDSREGEEVLLSADSTTAAAANKIKLGGESNVAGNDGGGGAAEGEGNPDQSHEDESNVSSIVGHRPVSHILKGHDGVVFSCRFGYGGSYLASTGDDRTVRLWKQKRGGGGDGGDDDDAAALGLGGEGGGGEAADDARHIAGEESNTYDLVWTGYGHTARVWDCAFSRDGIVSAGEDGTVRLWELQTGEEIATMRGHNCLNVWSIDAEPGGSVSITGGSDGTAKVWDLQGQFLLNAAASDLTPAGQDEDKGQQVGDLGRPGERSYLLPKETSPESEAGKSDYSDMSPEQQKSNEVVDTECALVEPATEHTSSTCEITEDDKEGVDESHITRPVKKKKKKKKPPKTKSNAQTICGMEFYSTTRMGEQNDGLLVVTRAGSLFTLDKATGKRTDGVPWCEKRREQTGDSGVLDPSTGSCVAIHPSGCVVAIGTKKAQVVLAPLGQAPDNYETPIFSAAPFFVVQGLKWIDGHSLLTFHIKGILVWWKFPEDCDISLPSAPPAMHHILSMGTAGVPMSVVHDAGNMRLLVGDSRGSIALFDIRASSGEQEQSPVSLVRNAHSKEHVTAISCASTSNDTKILSAGNDGYITEWTISCCTGEMKLRKALSVPLSSLTGVSQLWHALHSDGTKSLIAGGYRGNVFIVWDVTRGYQLLSINTGGRKRGIAFAIDLSNSDFQFPSAYALAICVGRRDGGTEIKLHSSGNFCESRTSALSYAIGYAYHGETVTGLCWFQSRSSPDVLLKLSGSNDCTAKLTMYNGKSLVTIKELPPHEGCVGAVCASQFPNAASTLLVTCGGKLSLTCYRFDEPTKWEGQTNDPRVHFLCANRLPNKPLMDHRIKTVKAIPLVLAGEDENIRGSHHLVLAGDSDGGLHLFVVPEDLDQPRSIVSHTMCTDSRPILCIDIVRVSRDHVIACVGDTSGQVCLWDLPGSIDGNSHQTNGFDRLYGEMPSSPLHIYEAHRMGTNCISAVTLVGNIEDGPKCSLVICSGGDDQAVTMCYGMVTVENGVKSTFSNVAISVTSEASSSALKGVKIMEASSSDCYHLYAAGYDQRVSLWQICLGPSAGRVRPSLHYLSSAPLDVSDVNCLDAHLLQQNSGPSKHVIAVGGAGVEVLSLDVSIPRAAGALRDANYLLITCGAGLSADSGLATYENMPEEYRNLCDPSKLIDDTVRFQKFWEDFAMAYSETKPHSGYGVLDRWCIGGRLKNLATGLLSPWFVYSSNVDGHFRHFDSFKDRICEIHGSAGEWICAERTGYDRGTRRRGSLWDEWNDRVSTSSTKECESSTFRVDELDDGLQRRRSADGIVTCPHCQSPARPNVLMFHDTDDRVLRSITSQRDRYQQWESQVEDVVVNRKQNLVILELGCGKTVPAVRNESEEVLGDCLSRRKCAKGANAEVGNVTLIRVNPKDAEAGKGCDGEADQTISIYDTAESALRSIDDWIARFDDLQV